MSNKSIGYFANSFIWGVIAKLLDAIIKFITIPLLLVYFGKDNYGLLTLAIATNAYMSLLDMGMNTGSVKFFSQWIATGNYDMLNRVSRTNLTFYLILGCINSFLLVVLSLSAGYVFNISEGQIRIFQSLLLILAAISLINWMTFVFTQLLTADEKIKNVQQILSIKSILLLGVAFITIYLKLSLVQYFIFYLSVNSLIIIPYYIICKKRKLIKTLLPAFYWKDFSVIFKYSLAIFAMGLFQFTATQSRPLVLGIFSSEGVSILAEYRIIEVFPIFIISIGGMLISIFLPKASKYILNKNKEATENFAYKGTLYTSILVSLLCFPIMLVSRELIILYVGESYQNLYIWLSLWVFTLTLYLHNSPVSSLVLATGKTRMLVYSSAIACVISIILNAILCPYLGVGSAVIGYLVYIFIQMSYYYFYFNNKVLGLNSFRVLKSFIIPTLFGIISTFIIFVLDINISNLLIQIIIKCLSWLAMFLFFIWIFKIISVNDLLQILRKE